MASLDGQVALVTGGSRGIGRAIALELAAAGARLAVTARTTEELQETVELIRAQGGHGVAFVADVTDQQAVEQMVAQVTDVLGPIDLLVNNAGMSGPERSLLDMPASDWWRVVEVNLQGPFLCSRAVLPGMVARGRGRIINIASNAAFFALPDFSAYSVSKAALVRLTDCLAEIGRPHNIAAFVISPGTVRTDMTRDAAIFKDLPESVWSPPERGARLCRLLAGGAADRLTGRYIHVTDDIDDLMARAAEIVENDRYAMRLQK